ncbi:iron-containing alcohol dehydrogenase [Feifania hominis]|uniref:Iron-containing alcohol dehydrogenase n=1 Tax=Feifania hominis TaxID=2763660 RepID=A0A926DH13_9FIRM|nr:iron-containing alcohol dehydrogenase [Feifania hominis]MBC8536910.1 iron-containing alcohol dehydrogenase [Feifania hominis]
MNDFTFQCSTKIVFGRGAERCVGEETARFSKNILLHYGGGSIKRSGLYDRVMASLAGQGIHVTELGGVEPNPRLDLVYRGIELCREKNIDFILAVGGGSVIDSAKAIALGVKYPGDVWELFAETGTVGEVLPTGNILTIPASGTEAGNGTVVKNMALGLKRNVNDQKLRPQFTILNPELTLSLSPLQTACGVSDMLSHVLERYFAPEKNVEYTDRLCEATMKTIIHNGLRAVRDPGDCNARAELMWCGTVAHNDFLQTGRTPDFASHKIDHEVNAVCDCTHGASIAVLFLAWCRYVYTKHIDKFAQFAVRVFDAEMNFENPAETAREGIARLERFYHDLGLSTRLRDLGVEKSDFATIAKNCKTFAGDKVGNLEKISRDDMLDILEIAY